MRFFVLPIFDGVIVDGHPIFWVVDAGVDTIKILDAHPLWHHRRWTKQKISSFIPFLVRIVLFLHFIGGIYLSKILFYERDISYVLISRNIFPLIWHWHLRINWNHLQKSCRGRVNSFWNSRKIIILTNSFLWNEWIVIEALLRETELKTAWLGKVLLEDRTVGNIN